MSDTAQIQERVRQAVSKLSVPGLTPPTPAAKSWLTVALGAGVVALSALTLLAGVYRKAEPQSPPDVDLWPPLAQDVRPPEARPVPTDPALLKRLEELEAKIDCWGNRVWLLGVAHNENAALANRIHSRGADYIYFDSGWRMSRPPKHLSLTQDQWDRLKGNVVK